MTIRGHDGMLGALPRDPRLPPGPDLPPGDGRLSIKVVHKHVGVPGYTGETVLSVARAYALSALTLAQAERDTARQERNELRALLQAVWDDVSSIDTDACLSPEVGRRVKATQQETRA
jgi:hypothetical protein